MQDSFEKMTELKERIQRACAIIRIDEKKKKIIELQHQMSRPDFWREQEQAKKTSRLACDLEEEVAAWEGLGQRIDDLRALIEMGEGNESSNLRVDAEQELALVEKELNKMEFALLFAGKYDHCDSVVSIRAGAGGTDAQDWAEMLLRMYLRFCESQKWQTKIVEISAGGEAGIKSVLFEVRGRNSYGYLKAEHGVHRLVRISPFDAEKMRHTSFALVEVLPLLEEAGEIEIKPDELRIDTYRAGGHGGQGVNKTDSAVRIVHLATKITVTCQNERSQQQNRETALKILRAKLQQYHEAKEEEERMRLRGEYTEAAWGNQIRSYVLHPYKMVKDHRTEMETSDVERVLDGDLILFMEAYLRMKVGNRL
ncbi:peptide chain release factor 2 [Candidatus Falkowbacteria bacterium]|nr:peptide chain release factor 2 [Candidatus Falkowbacteria bacterium]